MKDFLSKRTQKTPKAVILAFVVFFSLVLSYLLLANIAINLKISKYTHTSVTNSPKDQYHSNYFGAI